MLVAPSEATRACLASARRSLGLYSLRLAPKPVLSSVVTLRDGRDAIENILQEDGSPRERRILSLQGARLTAIALPWPPYVRSMDSCRNGFKDCEAAGPLMEIMGLLGELYNFTSSVDRDPDNNWGTKPVTGTRLIPIQALSHRKILCGPTIPTCFQEIFRIAMQPSKASLAVLSMTNMISACHPSFLHRGERVTLTLHSHFWSIKCACSSMRRRPQ